MTAILMAVAMVILVTTMGRANSHRPGQQSRSSGKKGDRATGRRGVKVGAPERDPKSPSVVTYRLMQDRKLPTSSQRAWRRITRPISRLNTWLSGKPRGEKVGDMPVTQRSATSKSVELQNFLEARNREIAQRKSDDPSKRGPEDTLH